MAARRSSAARMDLFTVSVGSEAVVMAKSAGSPERVSGRVCRPITGMFSAKAWPTSGRVGLGGPRLL